MSKNIFAAILVLALASLACGFSMRLPAAKTPGPDQTSQITISAPDSDTAHLTLSFGAGKLMLASGADKSLVSGVATYNIPDFKPETTISGADVEVRQGDYKVNGIPTMSGVKNEWNLKLGKMPIDLTIHSGAYEGRFDFGGLALTSLTVNDGAADTRADFSKPNLAKMSLLTYKTGASNVTLKNLGNANAASIVFESGAGNYTLDFGGQLQRDLSVNARAGMSNLTLNIATGIAATVQVSSGLSNVQFPTGWSKNDNRYTQQGSGPVLIIVVEMGAGNLQVTQ
jgi:hypothetical protein